MEDLVAILDAKELSEDEKVAFVKHLSAHWGVQPPEPPSGPRKALEEAQQLDAEVKLIPVPPSTGKMGGAHHITGSIRKIADVGKDIVRTVAGISKDVAVTAAEKSKEVAEGITSTIKSTTNSAVKASMYVKVETVRLSMKAKDGIADVMEDVLLIKRYHRPPLSSNAPLAGYKTVTIVQANSVAKPPYSIQKIGEDGKIVITRAPTVQAGAADGMEQEKMIALKYKEGAPTNDLCSGVYLKIADDCNGQPLYQMVTVSGNTKTKGDRFLGYCGYIWVVNADPNMIIQGQAAGWHWSEQQQLQELASNTFASLVVITAEAEVAAYMEDSATFRGDQVVLQAKPGTDNYANCSGIYTKVHDDCNGEPLYHNKSADRYLGYCGYIWVVNNQPNVTMGGECTGFHFSTTQGVNDLKHNLFESYDILSDAADVGRYLAETCQLFKGEAPAFVSPLEINQGPLGDCWLLGSMSALAEFPDLVTRLFVSEEPDEDGNFKCLLFDVLSQDWIQVLSDAKSQPYAHSNNGAQWVTVLERAFANLFGGYRNLSGNSGGLALMMLTGWPCSAYTLKEDGNWQPETYKIAPEFDYSENRNAVYSWCYSCTPSHDDDTMWSQVLLVSDQNNCVMNCERGGTDLESESGGPKGDFGMVDGHLYSLIAVKEVEGFRLVQCRNPWGKTEWGGDWSDCSSKWKEHPQVKEALNWTADVEDGAFWMSFNDFKTQFSRISIAERQPIAPPYNQ